MPEKPVRVEIVASMFVDVDRASNPEWRQQLLEMHQALGATAAEGTEINVGLTFNGSSESFYGPKAEERIADSRCATELAAVGDGLNADMNSLLSQAGGLSERVTKQLAGKLRNNGLSDVRAVLTAGYEVLRRYDAAGCYGRSSRQAIKRALSSIGVNFIPNAPSATDIALFCDSLDQVSGCALIRPGDEAETFELELETHKEKGEEFGFGSSGLGHYSDSYRRANHRVWGDAGLLKHRVSELNAMTVNELAAKIADREGKYADHAEALRTAQALQSVAQEFTADFTAAREALTRERTAE